jgi:hypothetical protein
VRYGKQFGYLGEGQANVEMQNDDSPLLDSQPPGHAAERRVAGAPLRSRHAPAGGAATVRSAPGLGANGDHATRPEGPTEQRPAPARDPGGFGGRWRTGGRPMTRQARQRRRDRPAVPASPDPARFSPPARILSSILSMGEDRPRTFNHGRSAVSGSAMDDPIQGHLTWSTGDTCPGDDRHAGSLAIERHAPVRRPLSRNRGVTRKPAWG